MLWTFLVTAISIEATAAPVRFLLSASHNLSACVALAEYLTNDFSLKDLKTGERLALGMYIFENMYQRCACFRNALIHVALEEMHPSADNTPALLPSTLPGEPAFAPPRVLVVDDAFHARELHRTLVLTCCPSAKVTTRKRCAIPSPSQPLTLIPSAPSTRPRTAKYA